MLQSTAAAWLLAAAILLFHPVACVSQEPIQSGEAQQTNASLLWGPYRPNLYFGVRPRIPKSLLTGLMWANVEDYNHPQANFRHTCEQGDDMAGYGWEEYDAQTGGREVIHDAGNKIDITIDYVKVPGGSHGGSWAARIKGNVRDNGAPTTVTSLVFYMGMEGLGDISLTNERSRLRYQEPVSFHGQSMELGEFDIEIIDASTNKLPYKIHESWDEKPLDGTLVKTLVLGGDQLWRAKDAMFASMKQTIDKYFEDYPRDNLPPPWQAFTVGQEPDDGNFHMVQKVFVGDFQFDVLFKSGSAIDELTPEVVDSLIPQVSSGFKKHFSDVFDLAKPFGKSKYLSCAESMLSNLVGGIGYFYGDSVVDRSYAAEYDEENEGFWEETAEARGRNLISQEPPHELFTSVPSRPFFPRGFLWDEGFHLIPIVEWDIDLALQIVESWFKLMDAEGWIAREQILGPEARSKVPQEFQVQYPHYANPPTLFLIVETLVEKIKSGKLPAEQAARLKSKLESIYPLLVRQYKWFRRTQTGDIKSYDREAFSSREAYRWRGRTPQHILTSGLDDYPRAQPPHPGELHLDLISWVGLMARSLSKAATLLSESDDAKTFETQLTAITRNIDDLHWSAKDKMYCDATVDDYEEHVHVCHKGYISLFPFMTGLLEPTSPHILAILDLIHSPDHLWSSYGIRSLSKSNEHYGTAENYWRSPIWINMNYLILRSLLSLATDARTPVAVKMRATEIYTALRVNVVNNVVQQWQDTGFAWEQYNPETGKGQRTQHFTGWTSLVVPMMTMPDLSGDAGTKQFRHEEL